MVPALAILALAAGLAWLAGTLFFLWRFRPMPAQARLRPTLLLAVTGGATLPRLFAALARQEVRPARLLAVVESTADPAHAALLRLAPRLPFPVEVVSAGIADGRGQKATALIAGCARIGAAEEAVVLLDADIDPPPGWLGQLLAPIEAGRADVVTGSFWLLPGAGRGLPDATAV